MTECFFTVLGRAGTFPETEESLSDDERRLSFGQIVAMDHAGDIGMRRYPHGIKRTGARRGRCGVLSGQKRKFRTSGTRSRAISSVRTPKCDRALVCSVQ